MSGTGKYAIWIAVIAGAAAVVWKVNSSMVDTAKSRRSGAGGVRIVLQVDPKPGDDWPTDLAAREETMESVRRTLANRVSGLRDVTEPSVLIQNLGDPKPTVIVELPGAKDDLLALRLVRSTATIEFYYLKEVQNNNNPMGKWRIEPPIKEDQPYIFTDRNGLTVDSIRGPKAVLDKVVETAKNKPILTGGDLLPNARADINQRNRIVINIEFNSHGADVFRKFTRAHVDDYLGVFFDGKLLTAPIINEPIPSGKAEISGSQSLQEARQTAEMLNAGALPVHLKVIDVKTL